MKKYISPINEVRNKGTKEVMTREEQAGHEECDKFPLLRRNCKVTPKRK